MSTVVPILSHDLTCSLIKWIRQRCTSIDFDPSAHDFQAAIALIAATDQYHQNKMIPLANNQNIFLNSGKGFTASEIPSLAQILVYRYLIRKIPVSPQLQRLSMTANFVPLPKENDDKNKNDENPEFDFAFDFNLDNNHEESNENDSKGEGISNQMALSYMTPHQADLAAMKFPDSGDEIFKNSFIHGVGQSFHFLIDRRIALLKASVNPPCGKTRQYEHIINSEIPKLVASKSQKEVREKFVKFQTDPTAFSLPESTDLMNPFFQHNFSVSPQHIGIVGAYDTTAAMGSSQLSMKMRQVIHQANKFFNALAATTQRQKLIKTALIQRNKDLEKEKNRAKRSQEKIRWDLLKQKDMVKYRETIKKMKDQRIQLILDQTDHYMKELSDKIRKTHSSTIASDEKSDDIYNFDLKLPEEITQPEHLNGTLKEYQVKGLQWLVSLYQSHLNGILADEMGLGKTIQTISLLAWLFEKVSDTGPHLVIAPLSTLSNWDNEFKHWFPQFKTIKYIGTKQERKELERKYVHKTTSINAILTSYQIVVLDKAVLSKINYSYIIIDEAHKLKNHEGKLSQTLTHHYTSKNRLLLTGTPLQNNPRELWSLLNFILPNIFNDHNKFDDWFTAPFAKAGEAAQLTQEEQWVVINQLHAVLRPFIFRRMKTEVANQLPDKKEETILCAMSAWQHSMYLTMDESSVMVMPDLKVVRMDNKTMQCRKICNHPYLFTNTYYINAMLIRSCGKFELLDRILPKFKATGHRVLIFSQMTELLDLLEDLLKYLGFTFLRLDGSTKEDTRMQLMEDFNAPNSEYFVFLLSTRAGGLGLNLQTADTVIIYDADWNPFADMQASSRVHRIGQQREVLILNLTTTDSVERKVLKVQNQKRTFEDMIIGAAMFNDESNIDDRKAVYQAVTAKNQSGGVSDVPNDEQINKIIARTPEELEKFEEMDIERDERYQYEWERAGHTGDYPRLVTYDELPEYLKMPASELIKDEELPDIRRSRSKNTLSMLDNITDQEFTRMIEEGNDPADHLDEISKLKQDCVKILKKARDILGNTFDVLPTPQELPSYYEIIKNPITFNQIKRKFKNGSYESVDALIEDLLLMARNAMRFNEQFTDLYRNAEKIKELCDEFSGNPIIQLPNEASALDDL
ncbi:Chromatin structure-remodeling complex subunit snf21 [Tritrichomonas foetus]|uniref:Chromatin structure-remodeling complex subunit snf21 n=1 Tax=Tritrichomonas foetus TaxID=1144522 RepID=A0A1J4KG21_9EUKA|nr:Chromatin structure-remodeling complex subunit snf21 [Tritrichomonas foetus]|eukprot:OHT08590.1 Chromatin structure-remodeling complex subunit snf21 [Tritrichomonas foetus]